VINVLKTGLAKLDEFLGGGLPEGAILDVFGASGTGKTQFLLQLAGNAIHIGEKVLYLDTTGEFRPERVIEIQKNRNQTYQTLENIIIYRVTNTSEQIKSIKKIKESNFSLVLIDNVTDLFSFEYEDDASIFEKNSLFMKFMKDLSQMAIDYKIPIVLTNMIRNIEGNEIENMNSAISIYAHIKVKLSKIKSKYLAEPQWLLNKTSFEYKIGPNGLMIN